jgi:RND family efflux transporter MFP subunit
LEGPVSVATVSTKIRIGTIATLAQRGLFFGFASSRPPNPELTFGSFGKLIGDSEHLTVTANFFQRFDLRPLWFVIGTLILMLVASTAYAQVEGFTEANRKIQLASAESGVIEELLVREGDVVAAGAVVAKLDVEMQRIQLELAEHMAQTDANLIAAKKTYEKRLAFFEQISQLREGQFVNNNELLRAELEKDIAFSKWKTAEDEAVSRNIEWRRAKTELERRSIKAPFAGVVTSVKQTVGEFISPVNPEILTLVDDTKLFAVFNLSKANLEKVKLGQPIQVRFEGGSTVDGIVDHIGIEVDPQSSTVVVKVLIENPTRRLRVGEAVVLLL